MGWFARANIRCIFSEFIQHGGGVPKGMTRFACLTLGVNILGGDKAQMISYRRRNGRHLSGKATVLAIAISIGYLYGCAGSRSASDAARTPEAFLAAINNVIEHGDLTNSELLAESFRLKFSHGEPHQAFHPKTNELIGIRRDFKIASASQETFLYSTTPSASYGTLAPSDGGLPRVSFGDYLDRNNICITRGVLFDKFGRGISHRNYDHPGEDYFYGFNYKENWIELIVGFSTIDCATNISLFQNRKMVELP
ncbi:hypothetical protein pRALTA_0242 (plasmid) [Cupriavidus taiwanensis LMG 19424]|nr:hypothetical protein pRALTA_0242 [Cupriavidus taiwanensis LMG 19424]SOZ01417.1 hypothetical protein CBM2600_P110008 [Cupriavidus taiwanensis]SPD62242.1 conserved protein of unknown function [Cupriavidus neocaledonicus]SOZ21022.1 hypothetical protein CBM2604_P110008 [Cupriavidus taiwanensis]SPC24892.1 conserved hypothetical protein [Cupriavidus taiwanensis]